MSYDALNLTKSGAISGSAADPVQWDLTNEMGRGIIVLTVTASVNTTLKIQEAANPVELASPLLSLPHVFTESLTANVTKRVTFGRDPSLPVGKAWVETGAGNYVINSGFKSHS